MEPTTALHAASVHAFQHQLRLLLYLRRHLQEVSLPAAAYEAPHLLLQKEYQLPEVPVDGALKNLSVVGASDGNIKTLTETPFFGSGMRYSTRSSGKNMTVWGPAISASSGGPEKCWKSKT